GGGGVGGPERLALRANAQAGNFRPECFRPPCVLGDAPGLDPVGKQILRTRKTEAMHLADHGVARRSDLAGDLAARQSRVEKFLEQFDALGRPALLDGSHLASSMKRIAVAEIAAGKSASLTARVRADRGDGDEAQGR